MHDIRKRLRKKAADFLEVPKDTLMDVPRVTLIGGLQLWVENYKGVLEFGDKHLRLALTQGELVVVGTRLVVKQILPQEIVIEGDITGINYHK